MQHVHWDTVPRARPPVHCTLAVIAAFPFSVKVHVFVLFPPLEQAPDQTTSRLFVERSVIDVPTANEAEPLLPTETLIPAGVEVTRSPPRPVAVTVNIALWAGGVTVKVAVRETPAAFAVIVTGIDVVTALVVIWKVVLFEPAATVTLDGTAAGPLLLDIDTANPPADAELVRVTVPCEVLPPTTLEGLSEIAERVGADGTACGVKRRTDDHAPAVPAELMPRTRHQCCRTTRVEAVNCEAVTVWSTTNGVEKLLESSI